MNRALVCLPFAGGGAGFYRAWKDLPAGSPSIVPVQLPGREELFIDPPYADAVEAGTLLAPKVAELVREYDEFALFGHSLGAVLAYEVARNLDEAGDGRLTHLFVSGSPGPWDGRDDRATGLADDEFVARVEEFAGYKHEALADPDMREILLPLLRADVEMHENYKPLSDRPIRIPVTSLRGADDALVSREHAREWRSVTSAGFHYLEVPGQHMYLVDSPDTVLDAVIRTLD
ncbi:thioesterase II family protein [Kitasatospora sp. A2-31]|uniref:thioesterase II family protein n=1 Tax=Kitasatospora sp. A2-31 TaxID=2916414 RepID=UPI001EEABE50|nr:alpha/beta fold hydrolase [Kitasatospora sp. A2-31]MCG6495249.1 alpha/beta fold hydrolase [Kitasatospora sp. A2-31]